MLSDVVDKIIKNKIDPETKLIRLWAITQLNYRTPLGEKAWTKMRGLTNPAATTVISFITGFCMNGTPTEKSLKKLVPELKN